MNDTGDEPNRCFFSDSEDVSTISPGSTRSQSVFSPCSVSSLEEQREPLSLVIKDESRISTPKHWKKSITRNFLEDENQENGPISPVTSQTAQVLLSLGGSRLLPIPVAPSRHISQTKIVQPWNTPGMIFKRETVNSEPSSVDQIQLSRRILSDPSNLPVTSSILPSYHNYVDFPQHPAPLQEVQPNLQLSSRPPFSVSDLSKPSNVWYTPAFTPVQRSLVSPNLENTEELSYNCLECKKSFSTQSGFSKHQQLHSSNQIQKDFSCKFCQKNYNSQSALKMHIRTHTLPCKCEECGKSFSRPWLLQGHMRTHTGEKPFSCTHCSRQFADKSNLRAHLQTHLENKKYSCPGCQKSFSRMSLLNKHTDAGCLGLQSRNEECIETLMGLSAGRIRT